MHIMYITLAYRRRRRRRTPPAMLNIIQGIFNNINRELGGQRNESEGECDRQKRSKKNKTWRMETGSKNKKLISDLL